MDMDIQELRWFQQVADGITVTEVSELEMVSQPAVSRGLARLEAEVGAPLLRRHGRTLRMTHAGVAFKHHVDAVIHHLDDGLAAVQQLISPETGMVSLRFQPSLGTWLVPDLVGSFHARHPGIVFDIQAKTVETEPAITHRNDVDLELSTFRPTGRGFAWQWLATEPMRLIVPRKHRLAGRRRVSLAEVADEPFITIRPTSLLRRQSEELCERAGFTPQFALIADDLPTIRGYVAAGLGVAVVPAIWDTSGEPISTRLRYVEIDDEAASREVGMGWSTERRMLPAAELFRDHVVARFRRGKLPRPVPATAATDDTGVPSEATPVR
jgi:DNA-binding transcriptional LysR family regulator